MSLPSVFEGLSCGLPYQTYLYSENGCLCVIWPYSGTSQDTIRKAKAALKSQRDIIKFEIGPRLPENYVFEVDGAMR